MEMAQGPQKKTGTSSVQFGIYKQQGNFVGKTVAQIREERGKLWGIPQDAQPYVGSQKVDENYTLNEGDSLEFHRRAGEKG